MLEPHDQGSTFLEEIDPHNIGRYNRLEDIRFLDKTELSFYFLVEHKLLILKRWGAEICSWLTSRRQYGILKPLPFLETTE